MPNDRIRRDQRVLHLRAIAVAAGLAFAALHAAAAPAAANAQAAPAQSHAAAAPATPFAKVGDTVISHQDYDAAVAQAARGKV